MYGMASRSSEEMARTRKDAKLDSRNAREELKRRREPYWSVLSEGLAIGYRKGAKGGTWLARHYSAERGRRYHSIGTADDIADDDGVHVFSFKQAQAKAREWFAALARQDSGEDKPAGPFTVKACLDEYLTWFREHRKTASDTEHRINALILPVLGSIDCNKLKADQIEKWRTDLANSPALVRSSEGARNTRRFDKDDQEAVRRRKASANRTLVILRAALKRAWEAGKIKSDDAFRRVRPFKGVNAARVRYLSIAESQRLINACDADFRLLALAALTTGARYGELSALCVSDFNRDSGTVHVRKSKNGKERHIVLNAEGVSLFKSLTAGKSSNAHLLTRGDGIPWRASHQSWWMAAACTRAGFDSPISFHGLRHTYASHAVMNGVPLLVVARNLGHSDTRMVELHYGHLAPSFIADAIRAGAPTFGIALDSNVASLDDQRAKA
jgi:integrase